MKATLIAQTAALVGSALGATIARRDVWQPKVGTSWQIILTGRLDIGPSTTSIVPDVEVFDIDLFYNTRNGTDKTIIQALHRLNKKVICYFSGGSYEPDRPDSSKFKAADKGNPLKDWPKENWLNLNSANVRTIMADRVKLAADMGCDGIDPDNVDGYGENGGNNPGFKLVQADSIGFINFLAGEAQKNNLAIGLKNAGEIIDEVLPVVQFSVNEECVTEAECSTFKAFTEADDPKPVFHIEYPNGDDEDSQVPVSNTTGWCKVEEERDDDNKPVLVDFSEFSTVIKNYDLDGWVQLCSSNTAITPTRPAA